MKIDMHDDGVIVSDFAERPRPDDLAWQTLDTVARGQLMPIETFMSEVAPLKGTEAEQRCRYAIQALDSTARTNKPGLQALHGPTVVRVPGAGGAPLSDPADLPGVRLDRSLAGLRASFLGIPGSSDVASTEAEHLAIRPPPAADPAPSVEERAARTSPIFWAGPSPSSGNGCLGSDDQ